VSHFKRVVGLNTSRDAVLKRLYELLLECIEVTVIADH